MANDRVFMRCKGCGDEKMMLKHYPSLLGPVDNNFTEWLEEHSTHHPNFYKGDLNGNPGFELFTESVENEQLQVTE